MKNLLLNLLFLIALLSVLNINFAQAPNLGSAANFVLFTSVGAVGNTGSSQLTGNIGTDNGAITGFGNVNGVMHNGDSATFAAAADLLILYNQLNTALPNFPHAPLLGNGDTLIPRVYAIAGNASLNLNLYLDAQGDSNAVFIFKISGTLSTSAASKVILLNGAQACNVFWKTEDLVSMAFGTVMRGTIVANNAAISISSGVILEGRALSTTGAVNVNSLLGYTPVGCGSPLLTGPSAPPLGTTACFAMFSTNGDITNDGITHVIGDIGTNVGAVGGFNPLFVDGTIYPIPDSTTVQAAADLNVLFNYLNSLTCDIELLYPAQFGNSLVLTPHVYCMNAAADLTDTLFLNAQGNPDAVFVIKINGALTTSTLSNVVLMNGAKSSNVFWTVEGAVTISSLSIFRGTLVVNNGAIGMFIGDTIDGRALTTNGAITPHDINIAIPGQYANIAGPDTIGLCQGDSVTLMADFSATYLWSTGDTTQSITVDTAGNFFIITTSACGNIDTSDITTVILNPRPIANAGLDRYIVSGDSAIIGTPALPGNSYSWTPAAGLSSDTAALPFASPTDTTEYILTVTSSAGCAATDTVIVYVTERLIANNDTAYMCANTGPVTFNILANDSNPAGGLLIAGIDSAARHGLALITGDSLTYTPAIGYYGVDTIVYFVCSIAPLPTCDTASVFIRISPVYNTIQTASVCNGDSLFIAGSYKKIAGVYVDTLQSVSGCDSIFTTILTVRPFLAGVDTQSICAGDSIFLGGAYRKLPGAYMDTVTTMSAPFCDSIVTTLLTIRPFLTGIDTQSICAGDSMFLGGAFRTLPGAYIDTVSATAGCDSIITTVLTVRPVNTRTQQTTICNGDSIFLGGAYRTLPGAYVDTTSNASGCDSIVITTLLVAPFLVGIDTQSICFGDSIFLGGAFRTLPGAYIDTVSATAGCDSIITTVLSVRPVNTGTQQTTICNGDSIFLGGAYRTLPGAYVDTISNASGCDSIVITTLLVAPFLTGIDTQSICNGDSIFLGGAYRTLPGVYIDTLNTTSGCDSIVTTVLTIKLFNTGIDTQSICAGDSVFLGGAYRKLPGAYIDTVSTAGPACDSIITTVLTVRPYLTGIDTQSICAGDSVFLGGAYRKLPGAYTDTVSTAGPACDSIITTVLTVRPYLTGIDTQSICAGDSIFLGGAYRTLPGAYIDTLSTTSGCDSIVTTVLTIKLFNTGIDTQSICFGDSIFLGGAYRTLPGSYMDTVSSTTSNCDSIITTVLTVRPLLLGVDTQSICNGDSIFLGGAYRTLPGAYTDTLSTTSGCDSIVTTVLTIKLFNTGIDTQSICFGDSIFLGGAYRTLPGAYMDTVSSTTSSCDSIITTVLTIKLFNTGIYTQSICFGDSIFLGGAYRTLPGAYMDTVSSSTSNCDSIITTVLAVRPLLLGVDTQSICNGDSIFLGGAYRTLPGAYIDTLSATAGCDSIVTTVLTIRLFNTGIGTQSICFGDSIFLGGAYRALPGAYMDTVSSSTSNCDSIITTVLTLRPITTINQQTFICSGDSIFLAGAFRNTAGTYTDTLTSALGCDSIINTTLTVNPMPVAVITANGPTTFCAGDSVTLTASTASFYIWSNGATTQSIVVFTSGNYAVTVSNGNGCSASTATTVTVNQAPNATITTSGPTTFCQGGNVTLTVAQANTYLWSTGETTQSITVTTADIYSVTVSSGTGCTAVGTVQVTSTAPPIVNLGADQNLCSCDTTIALSTNIQGTYIWSTGATTQSISITSAGAYSVTVTNVSNCTVSDTLAIQITCLTVTATVSDPFTGSVFIGNNATLHAEPGNAGNYNYTWTPSAYLDNANTQNPTVVAAQTSTTYSVRLTDTVSGCTASGSVTLTVLSKGKPVMPNAFSPNGDGLNDSYGPVIPTSMQGIYTLVDIRIYDRWGVMVYNGNGYWDGTFKDASQPTGTYVYYVTMSGPDPANPGVSVDYNMTGSMTLLH